jgi:hypothetical protein
MGVSATISVVSAALILGIGHADAKLQSLKDALQVCARVSDRAARLTCFEDLAKSSASGNGEAPKGADQTTSQPPPITATEQSAATKVKRRQAEEQGDQTRHAYNAVVLRAWRSGIGDYYIALTNGEVWKNEGRGELRPVKDGEAVELKPGSIGSWFMEFKTLKRPAIRVGLVQ